MTWWRIAWLRFQPCSCRRLGDDDHAGLSTPAVAGQSENHHGVSQAAIHADRQLLQQRIPASALINEPSLSPVPFSGKSTENATDLLSYFSRYVAFKQLPQAASLALFALLMRALPTPGSRP